MRTARSLTASRSICRGGRGGGVYAGGGGMHAWEHACLGGMHAAPPGGVHVGGMHVGGVCLRGMPPMDRILDTRLWKHYLTMVNIKNENSCDLGKLIFTRASQISVYSSGRAKRGKFLSYTQILSLKSLHKPCIIVFVQDG